MSYRNCICKICGGSVSNGKPDTQETVSLLGQAGINTLEKYIPVVGQVASVVNPIANKLVSMLPSNELASAKLSYADKYVNLFNDDQFLYNPDGSYMFPKEWQIYYLLSQNWLVRHNKIHGSPGYHRYMLKKQRILHMSDDDVMHAMFSLAYAHGH